MYVSHCKHHYHQALNLLSDVFLFAVMMIKFINRFSGNPLYIFVHTLNKKKFVRNK
jgi:hypothetical protein